jgi:hypothetical protein
MSRRTCSEPTVRASNGRWSSATERQVNPGAAQWRLVRGPWAILYDHPDGDDRTTARIVTLWRRR